MKTIKILLIVLLLTLVVSCKDKGVTTNSLHGDESTLPEELKGLKVYDVSLGEGNYVRVAIFDNKVNSTTYAVGKTQQTTIIVNPNTTDERIIKAKKILSETDDIIVIQK